MDPVPFFSLTNRLWEPMFPMMSDRRGHYITPAADIIEKDDSWLFRVDLPGVEKDDIDIEVNGDQLVISAKRQVDKEEKHPGYTCIERVEGQFKRVFALPDTVDKDKISARTRNGVIEVRVGKVPEILSRKVPVEGES